MAENKKLTTAEILAMARGKAAEAAAAKAENAPAPAKADEPAAEPAPAVEAAAETPAPTEKKPVAKPAAKPGGRPSVADMMAMARGQGGAGAAPAQKPAAEKKPVEKPAPKPAAAKPAAEKPAAPAKAGGPKDTASILAAARGVKPGPVSKAEAAAASTSPVAKPKAVAPPMPPKPDYAKPSPAKAAAKGATADESRRGFLHIMLGSMLGIGMTSLGIVGGLWNLGLARFMFPNILTEPPSRFKAGPKEGFSPGTVEEKFKAQYGVWVVSSEYNGQQQLYALKTVCTHLGCTPNWLEAEQKFKCPCHGSGFYKDGINFEGPAPRPLERYAIRIADDGQVEIDRSRTFQEELGQWADPASFIPATA
jgi:cytochrome b6-f complex iron-sulfur subunit